jgi:hypothetical protein
MALTSAFAQEAARQASRDSKLHARFYKCLPFKELAIMIFGNVNGADTSRKKNALECLEKQNNPIDD